jgi:hypothetical protein
MLKKTEREKRTSSNVQQKIIVLFKKWVCLFYLYSAMLHVGKSKYKNIA